VNWTTFICSEFARLGKRADETVVEELAQHAAAAFEAASHSWLRRPWRARFPPGERRRSMRSRR
jgi:hypothetical protein